MIPRVLTGVQKTLANIKAATGFALPLSGTPLLGPRQVPAVSRKMPSLWPLPSWTRVEDLELYDGDHVGLSNPLGAPPAHGVVLADLILRNADEWESRGYGAQLGVIVEHVACWDTKKEHDFYWNLADHPSSWPCITFRYGYSENAGAQTIQLVEREAELDGTKTIDMVALGHLWPDGDDRPSSPIRVHDYLSRNAGRNLDWGRAGFAYSFFGRQLRDKRFVRSRKNLDLARVFSDKWEQGHATGALLIGSRPRARVADCAFLGGIQEQMLVKVEGEGDELYLERCLLHARGGQATVVIEDGWERVWVAGCKGNARIRWRGREVGVGEASGWL